MKSILIFFVSLFLFGCTTPHKNQKYYNIKSGLGYKPQIEPKDVENYIKYFEAIDLIIEGRVEGVFQAHTMLVVLNLKDGSTVRTVEPDLDDIIYVIEACGEPCSKISIAQE